MLDRLELLVEDKIDLIKNTTVLILGLGGVGGYALESIVRCGIKKIIIVDSDKVELSNFNRQIIATKNNIGKYKTDAFYERIKSINEDTEVIKITEYIDENNIDLLFQYDIDYFIDCCDSIKTKECVILKCLELNIKLISCMGTGNKLNPSKLQIMKLKDTKYDPIARRLRQFVNKNKIKDDIYVICSMEENVVKDYEKIPSNSFVPATAGLLCTSFVINDIIKL